MYWTQTGGEFTGTEVQRADILAAIDRLTWHPLAATKQMPMSQGMALRAIMRDTKGTHKAVAWDGVVFAQYALLGLETQYVNALVRSYWVGIGEAVVCLCVGPIDADDGQATAHAEQPVTTAPATESVCVG